MLHKVYFRPAYLERIYVSATVDCYIQDGDNDIRCVKGVPTGNLPCPSLLLISLHSLPKHIS